MEKQQMKRQIENYISDLKRATHHPLLEKNIDVAQLDCLKSFFLLLPKLNGEKWTESMQVASVAVGAVYTGFQAHDTIDKRDAVSKEQQLTVLSGDYFSGMHFQLLASLPDFEFIRALSRTIGQINEVKTNFHTSPPMNSEQLLTFARTIETDCITCFLHTFGFSQYADLGAVVLPLVFLEQQFKSKKKQGDSWTVDSSIVYQSIANLKEDLRILLDEAEFLHPSLIEEINQMIPPIVSEST